MTSTNLGLSNEAGNALESIAGGTDPINAIGGAFGVPSCLLNLTKDLLGLIPTPVLALIQASIEEGMRAAQDLINGLLNALRRSLGLSEILTDDGQIRWISSYSRYGLDLLDGTAINTVLGFVGAMSGFAAGLYANIQATIQDVNSLIDCIGSYGDSLKSKKGDPDVLRRISRGTNYDDLVLRKSRAIKSQIEYVQNFINSADRVMNLISDVQVERAEGSAPEPVATREACSILQGTGILCSEDISTQIEPVEIFRLSYGPPKSKEGKFLLSIDGLYYDSQSQGLVPALTEITARNNSILNRDRWKLDFAPNLGGRGEEITSNDLLEYYHTITNPDTVNNSTFLQNYYDKDVYLQNIIGQKNRKIFDLREEIDKLIAEGDVSQVVIDNLKQVVISESHHFNKKINKRKKQIELAIVVPQDYGRGILFSPGNVPINDFSYLEGINFSLDELIQRKLVIDQEDVSGIVLPLEVTFVKQVNYDNSLILNHLNLPGVGFGAIVSDQDQTSGSLLSINKSVVQEGLISLYNYLNFSIDQPSGSNYKLFNDSVNGTNYNAQLVAKSASEVFRHGVGIAYLDGIVKHSTIDIVPSSFGSYVRLPAKKEFNDLLYSNLGATIETWTYVPKLTNLEFGFNDTNSVKGLYKLILANENTGLDAEFSSTYPLSAMPFDESNSTVKGFIMGFTRDRRITKNLNGSTNDADNPIDSACFFLAPTQSYDSSTVGFISKDADNCQTGFNWYNMKVYLSSVVNGKAFSSCGEEFCQIGVTFDKDLDQISIYLDGTVMAVSSFSDVFGNNNFMVPTLKKDNSFRYSTDTMGYCSVPELKYGPKLDRYFTPWIIGGGFTDGLENNNFMGDPYSGNISGLRGYIGSTKFYNRPLTIAEASQNYEANEYFFKNINIASLE